MKVCVVVLNSVWFDPRVRKQLKEYRRCGIEYACVGRKCVRYDEQKVDEIDCPVHLIDTPVKRK